MILVDAGARSEQSFDTRLVFAETLRRAGMKTGIDDTTLPGTLHRSQKYEAMDFLVSPGDFTPCGVVVLDAGSVCDQTLSTLRAYGLAPNQPVVAIGRFDSRQAKIGVQAKIAFAVGTEPALVDLAEFGPAALMAGASLPLFAPLTDQHPAPDRLRLLIFIPGDMAEDPACASGLSALAAMRGVDVALVTAAKAKAALRSVAPAAVRIFGYSELSPASFAVLADLVVVLGQGAPGDRIAQLCAEVIGAGGIVVDGTHGARLTQTPAPIVRGPLDLRALSGFLEREILPRESAIRAEVRASDWRRTNDISRLIEQFPPVARPRAPAAAKIAAAQKTVFLPTNGVGLGHAQRCALIAARMPDRTGVSFAAFPSCVDLVERRGFACRPLVQKSDAHADSYANDLVNYRRLRRWLAPGDRLVFDGVYVFDSIYRTILERKLEAVWIRRGLWRAHQTNAAALAREHAFKHIVVPCEAFDELNQNYSFGTHVHHVGPIVQPRGGRKATTIRRQISRQLGSQFGKLAVSMLGGGVAADRGPQLQAICAAMEARPDVLHLVVVWPNAKVAPELTLWKNTRVVRARDAADLAGAADFVVTAVGYNSFHEMLYHRIPAIFIPQTASYMDDQERRATAAVDRGLAEMVRPEDLLLLDRKLSSFLDGDAASGLRARLDDFTLPEPGNAEAARIIAGERCETRRLA